MNRELDAHHNTEKVEKHLWERVLPRPWHGKAEEIFIDYELYCYYLLIYCNVFYAYTYLDMK